MPSSWNNFEDKKPQRGRLLRLEILDVYSRADGPEPARKQTVWMGCAQRFLSTLKCFAS